MSNIEDSAAPPDVISKIVTGFQYETVVDVPGPEGEIFKFKLGVLWDDEERALQREIGFRIASNDFITRELEIRFETVLRATVSIGHPTSDEWFILSSEFDDEETRFRRGHYRKLLSKMPRTVEYLYREYMKLVAKRDKDFDGAIEDIKKSLRTPSVLDKLEGTPQSDSPFGEAGGS